MSFPWVSVDTRKAILCAFVPVVPAFVGTMVAIKDAELLRFIKDHSLRCNDRYKYAFLSSNIVVAAPFGYASHLLNKAGGGFSRTETKMALGLYGATILSGCFLVPLLKKKNIKAVIANAAVFAGFSIATTIVFYTIDKTAAYWTMPFTLWAILFTGLTMKATCGASGGGASDKSTASTNSGANSSSKKKTDDDAKPNSSKKKTDDDAKTIDFKMSGKTSEYM